MERRTGIIIATAIAIMLIGIGCIAFLAWRTSNAIRESFVTINNGLDSVQLLQEDRRANTRAMLDSFVCPEMAAKADSLHAAYESIALQIDALKESLAPFPMDDTRGPDSLFRTEERGTRLHRALLDYFDLAQAVCMDDSVDQQIALHADFMRNTPDPIEWQERNFVRVPAAACQAILSMVKSGVASTEALVLNDLLARCDSANKK